MLIIWWLKNLKYASQINSNWEEIKKNLINLIRSENIKNVFLIFHRNQRLQNTQNLSHLDANLKTTWTNKKDYNQLQSIFLKIFVQN